MLDNIHTNEKLGRHMHRAVRAFFRLNKLLALEAFLAASAKKSVSSWEKGLVVELDFGQIQAALGLIDKD